VSIDIPGLFSVQWKRALVTGGTSNAGRGALLWTTGTTGTVCDGGDLLRAPEMIGSSMVRGEDGVLYKGMPYAFTGVPFTVRQPAPDLGEDTFDILTEVLGLPAAEIAALEAAGVIGNRPRGH
jgi:hypothetical protein